MWMRRSQYGTTLLSLVLVLATTDFTNGSKSSPNLDIHRKLLSDGHSQNISFVGVTICIKLPEVQEVDPAGDYFLTLTDSTGTTLRGDKSVLQNNEGGCFHSQDFFSEFNMKEHVDVSVYKIVTDENEGPRIYKLLSENIMFLAPKIDALNGNHALVQWNNPDAELFSLSDGTDGSSLMLCKSQNCQFILENSNQLKYMNVRIQSENKTRIKQTVEIEINMDKGYAPLRESVKINHIRQSINFSTGYPFLTIELEAPDLPQVECVTVQYQDTTYTQVYKMCDGWDGSQVEITIPHAEIPAELDNIKMLIISGNYNSSFAPEYVKDVTQIKFNTSGFDTTIAIVGSDSGDSNAFLRVKVGSDEEDVSVGDDTCIVGKTCYYPYSEQPIKERKKEIVIDGKNEKIIHYDNSTMPYINLDELSEVKLVNEKRLDIATNYNALNNSIKVFIFDPKDKNNNTGELECSDEIIKDPISCNLKLIFSMTDLEQLNLVVMMLNPYNKVLKSTLVVLDDFKIKVEMFTLSSLKVTWNGNSEEHYLLDIAPVPNSYKNISTMCTSQDENCLAFFTNVSNLETKNEYTLSVKKEGSKTKVVQTIIMADVPGHLDEVNISKIIESKDCTKLDVDLLNLPQVRNVEVAVTRLNGRGTAKQTIISATKIEDGNIYSSDFYTNPEDENAFNNVTELILLGYSETNEIIATSYLSYQYADILVDLASVGNDRGSDGWSLRLAPINEDQVLYTGNSKCTFGEACYIIEPEMDTLEICVDMVDAIDTRFKLCDETQEPSEFQGIKEISNLILTDETDLEVNAEFNSSKETIEILLYDPHNSKVINDAQNCIETEGSTSCKIALDSPVPEELLMFNVLIVVIDSEKVLESLSKPFEDLKLNVKNLTQDIVTANWHHSDSTDDYWVHLEAKAKVFTSDLKSTCSTDDTCAAVFSHVEPIEYIFTVQKAINNITKVAKTYTLPDIGGDDPPEEITVSNIIESNGCTKITLEKTTLLSSLMDIGVSITSKDGSGTPTQTFVPGTKISSEDNATVVFSIPFMFDSSKTKQNSDDTEMVLVGLDENNNVIASTELSFHYQELTTKISAVGSALDVDGHSIRVVLADGESLQNAPKDCETDTPCYFIETNSSISVCNEGIDGIEVPLCNEGSSEFEVLSDVSVSLSTDGLVEVSTTLLDDNLVLEVLVYDETSLHNILLNDTNYKCTDTQISNDKYSCSQKATMTRDLKSVWVLVVAVSTIDNAVVQSTKIKKNIHVNEGVEDWVIVLSTMGGIFGVVLIIFATLVTWKKLSIKKQEKNIISQDYNTRKEKKSNINNKDKERYEDDLHMSQLNSRDHYTHDTAYDNPAFANNINNNISIAQNTMQNRFTGHYAPRNNTNIVNNVIQNPYVEPYTSGNVAKGNPRPFKIPTTNQNVHARHINPPIQNVPFRYTKHIPEKNGYNSHSATEYSSPYKPPTRANEPIYARMNSDNATASALERVPLGPIPRISVPPSRAKQYKEIRETTVIPPHGNWDVDI